MSRPMCAAGHVVPMCSVVSKHFLPRCAVIGIDSIFGIFPTRLSSVSAEPRSWVEAGWSLMLREINSI